MRDTYNLGFSYSIDPSRLIKQAIVIGNDICYPEKLVFNLYDLFSTRYKLHKEAYTHPCVNQIEYMILDVLKLVDDEYKFKDYINDPEKFIKLTDFILYDIKYNNLDTPKMIMAKNILNKLHRRKFYKIILNKLIDKEKYESIDKNVFLDNRIKDKDIILTKINLNYNLGDKNPVDKIYFYEKINSDENVLYRKIKINKDDVSLFLPKKYQETYIRIYCKEEKLFDYSKKKINEVFEKLCKKV